MAAVASRVSFADSEETPVTGGASSSATRPRWADIAEEDEGEAAAAAKNPQQPGEATCGNAPRDAEDADSNCSTSACSDHDAEALREERFADLVASDEEEPPRPAAASAAAAVAHTARGASSSAAASSSTHWVPRRAGKGGGGAAATPAASAAASQKGHRRGQWHWDSQWDSQWQGWWKDNGAASQGRWESRKDASWQQPRGGKGKQKSSQGAAGKRQCQFTIGIEEEPDFRVVRRLLGLHGKHVKRIAEESGAKLRLRGHGSGFKEGPEQEEPCAPQMHCLSAPDARSYDVAVRLLREHLEEIYEQHRSMFPGAVRCPQVDLHEGPREGSF